MAKQPISRLEKQQKLLTINVLFDCSWHLFQKHFRSFIYRAENIPNQHKTIWHTELPRL